MRAGVFVAEGASTVSSASFALDTCPDIVFRDNWNTAFVLPLHATFMSAARPRRRVSQSI